MAAVDIGKKRKLKEAPPVPIKTYRWEDVRRDKKRGKYPYTYLYKNLLEDLQNMEDDKKPLVSAKDDSEQKKPVQDEKKRKKVVRKLKKTPNVDELSLKDKAKEMEKSRKKVEEPPKMDVEEVLPQADVGTSEDSKESEEKKSDEVKIEEIPASQADKPEEDIHAAKEETGHLTITTETRDLSAERQTNEDKEEETISIENERITKRQDSTDDMEIKYEPLIEDESLDKTDRMSVDLSPDVISKADSKNTESEDTYTESNIEQYLDKEEISKSVSDASGLEGATSVSDVEFTHDNKPDVTPSVSETPSTLEIPQDHKRKHSGSSEMTKSNLSLFEKIKNTKFKPPTFKIPKIKKLTFHKKGSKRVKHDPKEQKSTTATAKSEVTLQRRMSESPVYIHIPLKPTAEDLEKERQEAMKLESYSRLAETSDSSTDRLNESKDTNGTLSSTITSTSSTNVNIKPAISKWKGLQSKTDKKSPPFKKKSKITNGKKTSPKSEVKATTEKKTSPVTKKRGDSPVEYIYIPLKPPENETCKEPSLETEKSLDKVDQVEAVNKDDETTIDKHVVEEEEKVMTEVRQTSETKETEKPATEIKQLPKVVSKPDEGKSKGAIKKKTNDKGKNMKDKTTKLTKDIKKLASKLKGVHKKTKRAGSKRTSLKSTPKPASFEKKSSPTSKKRGDSPVEYIYIPLKGPLVDEKQEEIKDKPTVREQTEEKSSESQKEQDTTEAMNVEHTVKCDEHSNIDEVTMAIVEKEPSSLPAAEVPIDKTVSTATPIKSNAPESVQTKTEPIELKQVEDTKKLSLLSKLKGFKPKTEKKSPPAIKKGIKQFTAKKISPKSLKKETVGKKSSPPPSVKRSDSPVEYIYIPLKPLDSEVSEVLSKLTDDKADETPMDIDVERMEINDTATEENEVTTNGDVSVVEQETTEGSSVMSKLKDTKSKPQKESPPTKKKTAKVSPKRDSSPVDYIYIPLNPVENVEDLKQRSVTPIRETITPVSGQIVTTDKPSEVDSELEIQSKPKETVMKQTENKVTESKLEKVPDKPKENIMTKLKGLKPKKAQAPKTGMKTNKGLVSEKRKSPPKAIETSDAPVDYIYIPLKSQSAKETESKIKEPTKNEESELPETKSLVEQVETENIVKESMKETVESATVSEIVPQNSSVPSEESKKEQTPVRSSVVAESKFPPSSVPSTEKDKTKKARLVKESVIKKWQGFKTKPLQKPMPLKRMEPKMTSPKTEKKSTASKSKEQPPVVVRRGDSPVDYIYIPLNPTEEQLEFEREIEQQKRLAAPKVSSAARTPERSPEPTKKSTTEEDKSKKGAVKKQPSEKGNKIKDTTSKLTEDIKKFALKLKDMQKKSKKPTFKTFKRGSKSGSKKMSPTTSKKPVDSRSPPMSKQRGDSPVEYIFIPLKPSPEEEQFERELKEKQIAEEKNATLSLPQHSTREASVTEQIEELAEVSRKPVVVEAIQKTGKKEPVKPVTATTPASSPFNSLKKTKEFGKNKLQALKDAVQPAKEKKIETKVEKAVLKETAGVTTKEKSDSLKGTDEHMAETDKDESAMISPSEIVEPTKKRTTEEPHYEPLTKEDEEDGLKTAIIASLKEVKLNDEEPAAVKSVLKAEDSPKLNRKESFKSIRAKEAEHGLDKSQNGDENAIYETIQIQGEPPDISASATRKLAGEQTIKDMSLEDDHNKWSKSTDHEYEPVNPPPEINATPVSTASPLEAPRPIHGTDTDLEPARHRNIEVIDTQQQSLKDARLLRIPLDKELVVPSTNAEETISSDKSLTSTLERTDTPDSRSRLLARALGTPDTSSRTDGISTSQVDSSALEHLPLKKENRQKSEMVQSEGQGPNIQDKIRNQAGRLKTKIKGMKRPTFTIPNPKFSPKFRRPKFEKSKLQRPKFQTPKFTMPSMPKMPKMPDRPKMNMPSFSLPRPGSLRRQQSADDKHISTTESSADSKKNNIFDFRTYPRLFDRSKKTKASTNTATSDEVEPPAPEFATVPRAAARKKGPVGSRWVHRFTDIQYADEESTSPRQMYNVELQSKDRGDSLERRMEADLRYEEALAEDDDDMREYERENQDINRHSPYIAADRAEYSDRWRHGSFRKQHHDEIDEFDNEMHNGIDHDERHTEDEMQHNLHDEHSSVASSGSRRHRGVIEEIDSDQFFLREKGISQDNIQVGLYLSSEIRDAFRQPMNALSQMQGVQPGYGSQDYDLDASDLSLTRPSRPKRKHWKKTKRVKKTPHASQEQIQYDQESVNTEPEEWSRDYNDDYKTFPPTRPKRNRKQQKNVPDDVHEADMPVDDEVHINLENLKSQEDLPGSECMPNILGYVEKDVDISEEYNKYLRDEALMYENEIMKDIQQPEIVISADHKYEIAQQDVDRYLEDTGKVSMPKPPTRRHKSLKSLNLSEHDSIMGEFNKDRVMQDILEQELNVYRIEHEYLVPVDEPPVVPIRRTRSRSRTESQAEDDRTSHGAESLISECHEPPCLQDIRDTMGYAVIDKSKQRDPPLPSAPRRRRSTKSNKSSRSSDTKFFTVPRPLNDTPPARPQRNYSTLGPNRPPRRKSELDLSEAEEKENIDITQYIEIEDDDHSRDLQSGEIINKMKGRPLPAPPRPPRKTREKSKEALHDITHESNIMSDSYIDEDDHKPMTDISLASPMEAVEEMEVSTQTDPLPDDFCCEEVIEEPTDRIVAPTRRKRSIHRDSSTSRSVERPKTPLERSVSPHAMIIERRVQTPTDDVTHASLLVRPVPEYPPDSYVSKRFAADIPEIFSIPQPRADDDVEEPSVIPTELLDIFTQPPDETEETFAQSETFTLEHEDEMPEKPQRRKSQAQVQSTMKSEVPTTPVSPPKSPQPQIIERIIERHVPVCITPAPDTEVEILKAHRLQVTDLDVERLNVTELQAQKILVSEIDGVTLQISELTSKSGNLVVNGLEISSGLLQEILERLQPAATQPPAGESSPGVEQVSTQTNIEDTPKNTETNTLAEPANFEQIGTQTSIDELDPLPVMEPVSTQTSLDEPDTMPNTSVEQVATQTSIEEPDDCNVPDLILASSTEESAQSPYINEMLFESLGYEVPDQFSPTMSDEIIIDLPGHVIIETEDPYTGETIFFQQPLDERLPLEFREMIEREMELEREVASKQLMTSSPQLIDIPEEEDLKEEKTKQAIEFSLGKPTEDSEVPKEFIELKDKEELLMDIVDQAEEAAIKEESVEQSDLNVVPAEVKDEEEVLVDLLTVKPEEKHQLQSSITSSQTDAQEAKAEHSIVPKEFRELKDEQEAIIVQLQKEIEKTQELLKKEMNVEVKETPETKTEDTEQLPAVDVIVKEIRSVPLESSAPAIPPLPKEHLQRETVQEVSEHQQEATISPEVKENSKQSEYFAAQSGTPPSHPPLPQQDNIQEPQAQVQMIQGVPYPVSYYPEYVHSIAPHSFYTLRSAQSRDLSEDDIPVHHRRRRHHRHMSRSSSDEDRRTVARRTRASSADPSIPQLTAQLAKACTTSAGRVFRQMTNYLSSSDVLSRQQMQIVMVILLVLIAGLILIGLSGGKTVHLHHWEYFNPPKEL
ncbi:uncharacterized protein CBL_11990 [Carabus blaptoides fortunei]